MTQTLRDKLIKDIQIRLGFGIIDNELDLEHIDYAIDRAVDRFRQRSSNAVEESHLFLTIQQETTTYTLPDEVQEVHAIMRRFIGPNGQGTAIDPFSMAFTNSLYMIQNPGNINTGGTGMLTTYDFAMQHQKLVGRMFGRDIQFQWDTATKKLTMFRKFTAEEEVIIHCFNTRPLDSLLKDAYTKLWIQDYAMNTCKLIMAEARSKFASLAGPQGGITMNGDALKQEAQAELERLENEIMMHMDGGDVLPFIIG